MKKVSLNLGLTKEKPGVLNVPVSQNAIHYFVYGLIFVVKKK